MTDANKLVIFDCDGTLVDGQHLIVEAMHATFSSSNLPIASDTAVRGIIGLSLVEAMEKLLPEAHADFHFEMAEKYKTTFSGLLQQWEDPIEPLYDGINEALEALEAEGCLLGVATGKSMRGLVRVLEHHGLKEKFITLQTADGHPSKPHPSMIATAMADAGAVPATTVMIGDTSFDMTMAKAAKVSAIGVHWGYHNHETLVEAGADVMAEHCHQLPQMVKELIEK